ncbi:MAG: RNA polymerase sigma factor [Planctomycetota bacterium]|jgi:RNA polymerase sigma-70 factor (ECF subfamily)
MDEIPKTRASLLVRICDPQDERAWTEFLEIYEPLVYRLARRRGFQHADAVELCQEVFSAVASAIGRWQPDPARGRFRAWLFRIARNLMINWLARERRRTRGTGDTDVKDLLEQQPARGDEDSALFDLEYKRQTFRWAAEQIRGRFRRATWEAFWLSSVEGEPIDKVARQFGMTPGAVYIARSRVMARLRETIERLEREAGDLDL